MFHRQCDKQDTHDAHVYEKVWVKTDLPDLLHPELYPDRWMSRYKCAGVDLVGWRVDMLHDECTPCEACADMAVDKATREALEREVWTEVGVGGAVKHMAEVIRL